jgi:hypothetical protein
VHAAGNQVLTVITDDTEKRIIGLKNSAFELGNDDPDDVGVDQAADLAFVGAGDGGVKARRLRQQNDQDGGRGEQRKHAACIEAEAEAPADEYGAECHFQNCRQSDDHQPLIKQRALAKPQDRNRARGHQHRARRRHAGCRRVVDPIREQHRQVVVAGGGEQGQSADERKNERDA